MNELAKVTKEKARAHFNELTEQYGVRHTFSFDEVYDYLWDRRIAEAQKKEFRTKIKEVEKMFRAYPTAVSAEENYDYYPLKHEFADGMYIRELTVPAQHLTVTKIHAQTHPFFILKGRLAIYSEKGVQWIEAPYHGITQAGTKRIIWHDTEVVIVTVHRTNEMELDKIEADVIAPNFETMDNLLEEERTKKIAEILKKEA